MSVSRARPSILDIRCSLSLCNLTIQTRSLRRQRHSLHCLQNPRFHRVSTLFPARSVPSPLSSVATTHHGRNSVQLLPPPQTRKYSKNHKSKSLIIKERAEERARRRAAKESGDFDPAQWSARSSPRSSDHVRPMPLHKWRRFEEVKRLETDFENDLELEVALQQRKPAWVRRQELRERRSGSSTMSDPVLSDPRFSDLKIRQVNSSHEKDGHLNGTRIMPAKWSQLAKQVNERTASRSIVLDGKTPSHHQPDDETSQVTPTQTESDTQSPPLRELGQRIWGRSTDAFSNVIPSKDTNFTAQEGPREVLSNRPKRNLRGDPIKNTTFSVRRHLAQPYERRPPTRSPSPRQPFLKISRGPFDRLRKYPPKKPIIHTPEHEDDFWIRDVDADVPEIEKARRYYDFDPELLEEFALTTTNTPATLTSTRWPPQRTREEATPNKSGLVSGGDMNDLSAKLEKATPLTRPAESPSAPAEDMTLNTTNSPTDLPETPAIVQTVATPASTSITEEVPQAEAVDAHDIVSNEPPRSKASLRREKRIRNRQEKTRMTRSVETGLLDGEIEQSPPSSIITEDPSLKWGHVPTEKTPSENLTAAEIKVAQPHQSIETKSHPPKSLAAKNLREAEKLRYLLQQMQQPHATKTEKQVVQSHTDYLIATHLGSLPFGHTMTKGKGKKLRRQKTQEAERAVRARLQPSKVAESGAFLSSMGHDISLQTQTGAPKQWKSRKDTDAESESPPVHMNIEGRPNSYEEAMARLHALFPNEKQYSVPASSTNEVEEEATTSRNGSKHAKMEASPPPLDTKEAVLPKAKEKAEKTKKEKIRKNTVNDTALPSTDKPEAAQAEAETPAPRHPKMEQALQLDARRAAKKAAEEHFARMTSLAREVEEKKRQIEQNRQGSSESDQPIYRDQHKVATAQADADAKDGWAQITDIRHTERFKQLMAEADVGEEDADDMEGWQTIEEGDEHPFKEAFIDTVRQKQAERDGALSSAAAERVWGEGDDPVESEDLGELEEVFSSNQNKQATIPGAAEEGEGRPEPRTSFPAHAYIDRAAQREAAVREGYTGPLHGFRARDRKSKVEEEDPFDSKEVVKIKLKHELKLAQKPSEVPAEVIHVEKKKVKKPTLKQRTMAAQRQEEKFDAKMNDEEIRLLKELRGAQWRLDREEKKGRILRIRERSLELRQERHDKENKESKDSVRMELELKQIEEEEAEERQAALMEEKLKKIHAEEAEESEEQEELPVMPSKKQLKQEKSSAFPAAKAEQQSARDKMLNAERLAAEQQTAENKKRDKLREKRAKERKKKREKLRTARAAVTTESLETQTEETASAPEELEPPNPQIDETRSGSKKRQEKLKAYAAAQAARQLERDKEMHEPEGVAEQQGPQIVPDDKLSAAAVEESQQTQIEDMATVREEAEQQNLRIDEIPEAREEAEPPNPQTDEMHTTKVEAGHENLPTKAMADEEIRQTREEAKQEVVQTEAVGSSKGQPVVTKENKTPPPASQPRIFRGATLIGDGKKILVNGSYFSRKISPKSIARQRKRTEKRQRTKENRIRRMEKHAKKIDEMIAQDPSLTRLQALTKIHWDIIYAKQDRKKKEEASALEEVFNVAEVEGHSSRKLKNMAVRAKRGKILSSTKFTTAKARFASLVDSAEDRDPSSNHVSKEGELKVRRTATSTYGTPSKAFQPPKGVPSAEPETQAEPEDQKSSDPKPEPEYNIIPGPLGWRARKSEKPPPDPKSDFDTWFQRTLPPGTPLPNDMPLTPFNLKTKDRQERWASIKLERADLRGLHRNRKFAAKLDLDAENLQEFFKREEEERALKTAMHANADPEREKPEIRKFYMGAGQRSDWREKFFGEQLEGKSKRWERRRRPRVDVGWGREVDGGLERPWEKLREPTLRPRTRARSRARPMLKVPEGYQRVYGGVPTGGGL